MLTSIAAVGKNFEIGKNGDLCFRFKADLRRFKETTVGHKILMGHNTFDSLPKRLEGREYYVVTRNKEQLPDWVNVVEDLRSFLEEWRDKDEEMFVIGGGSIYAQAVPYCNKLILTEIDAEDKDATVFFPRINWNIWTTDALDCGYENGIFYTVQEYTRRPNVL